MQMRSESNDDDYGRYSFIRVPRRAAPHVATRSIPLMQVHFFGLSLASHQMNETR